MPIGYKCQDDEPKWHRAPEELTWGLRESSTFLFQASRPRFCFRHVQPWGFAPLFSLPGVILVVICRLLQLIRPKTLDTTNADLSREKKKKGGIQTLPWFLCSPTVERPRPLHGCLDLDNHLGRKGGSQ